MDSCPKELEPYDEAHNLKLIEEDYLSHMWWGTYGLSALGYAISHCFSKNSTAKYIEKPIMSDYVNQKTVEKELTEEEKRRKTEQLFMQLKIMGANHKRNQKTKDSTV